VCKMSQDKIKDCLTCVYMYVDDLPEMCCDHKDKKGNPQVCKNGYEYWREKADTDCEGWMSICDKCASKPPKFRRGTHEAMRGKPGKSGRKRKNWSSIIDEMIAELRANIRRINEPRQDRQLRCPGDSH
jgi:hypothetical protein